MDACRVFIVKRILQDGSSDLCEGGDGSRALRRGGGLFFFATSPCDSIPTPSRGTGGSKVIAAPSRNSIGPWRKVAKPCAPGPTHPRAWELRRRFRAKHTLAGSLTTRGMSRKTPRTSHHITRMMGVLCSLSYQQNQLTTILTKGGQWDSHHM